jgi:spore coat protein SA
VAAPQIDLFYNFVDINEYDPAIVPGTALEELRSEMKLGDSRVVLFVGRMIEQKGPHLALRAFRRIAENRPDVRMVFVGAPWYSRENSSPFVEMVKAEAGAVADRIRFTGYVDHTRMPAYYALADVVCAPSIWDDPSPFVAYEAQAMAKPVLGSTRGGIPEIIDDHRTGRCIDVFNTSLFSQILGEWLDQPQAAREIGQRGRERVRERFDLKAASQKIIDVYDRLARKE